MKRFLIFALKSVCYDSYLYFAHSLAAALTEDGASVELFSTEKEPIESMERFAGQTFDAVFDFNSALPRLEMEEGGYFLDLIDAPFYNIILDHPLYHHDTLKKEIQNFHALCLDENHADYVKQYYPHIRSVHVFPMTGKDIGPDGAYPEKQIDVLFSGTYTDYREVERSMETVPAYIKDIVRQMIDLMLQDGSLTQEAALRRVMPSVEEAEIIEETFPLHMQACFLCDSYLRAYKREQMLIKLAKENVPLTLCGNGWRKSPLADFPQISIIDDTSFRDTFFLFRQSKIVLNLLPEFKCGTHDRVYSAMLNHGLCLTDASPYLKKEFEDGRELCFYDASDFSSLAEQMRDLLSTPAQLKKISQNGYFKAKESHSWQARAAYLLSLL